MSRHIQPRKSIQDWGGIQPYLDGTADKHNGLMYKDFLYHIKPRKHKIPITVCAEDFGVSPKTWYDWVRRYFLEQERVQIDLLHREEEKL